MLTDVILDSLNEILQKVMKSPSPFGGISVLLFGDLLQLGPPDGNPIYKASCMRSAKLYRLEQNHRCHNDQQLSDVLEKVRKGEFFLIICVYV